MNLLIKMVSCTQLATATTPLLGIIVDSYPEHLAPEFNERGGVETPFDVWWPRVRAEFPAVPEDVARYWLHEHWSHSRFGWLPSREYRFNLCEWNSAEFVTIRSRWCDWSPTNEACREQGKYLIEELAKPGERYGYSTARFMLEHGEFPVPPIVLDNSDGHIARHAKNQREKDAPPGIILVEGHRRFNMALYLQATGRSVI